MWDKFRGAVPNKLGRPQQKAQVDDRHGPESGVHGSNGYSYRVQGGPPPLRPPRDFEPPLQYAYDDPPIVVAPPPAPPRHPGRNDANRHSGVAGRRPVSSIYSQPSPIQTRFGTGSVARGNYNNYSPGDGISPPSSPDQPGPRDGAPLSPPDISPIEEDDETYQGTTMLPAGQNLGGNIPSLRRERRQKMDAANTQLRESKSRERMRHQPPQPKPAEMSKRGYHGGEVRWDPATGELTSSDKGRPSQVKPAEYAREFGDSPPRQPAASNPSPFGERVRRIAPPGFALGSAEKNKKTATPAPAPAPVPAPAPANLTAPARQTPPRRTPSPMSSPTAVDPATAAFGTDRPEWKGGSGRTAIVKPMYDNLDVGPLRVPQKNNKRDPKSPSAATSPVSLGKPVRKHATVTSPPVSPGPPISEMQPTLAREQPREDTTTATTHPTSYPSPPLSADEPTLSVHVPPPRAVPAQSQTQSPASPNTPLAVRRKPTPSQASLHRQQDSISSTYSQSDPYNYAHYTATHPLPNMNPTAHSVTVGEWAQSPPRPADNGYDEAHDESPSRPGEGVMDRRRPKLSSKDSGGSTGSSDQEPVKIRLNDAYWSARDRKALGHGTAGVRRNNSHDDDDAYSRCGSMAGSIHKNLPPAPPETTAKDRVDQLNAQLKGLANRRLNLTRCIKQMTELMPTDNIMASAEVLHKREVERRKVEALKAELAEVQREEYDLGIKLHRAYKRIDRTGEYEPAMLWVRRVTG